VAPGAHPHFWIQRWATIPDKASTDNTRVFPNILVTAISLMRLWQRDYRVLQMRPQTGSGARADIHLLLLIVFAGIQGDPDRTSATLDQFSQSAIGAKRNDEPHIGAVYFLLIRLEPPGLLSGAPTQGVNRFSLDGWRLVWSF
jgi:hypothetical protein